VVEKLVECLQGLYPKTRISIRNDPDTEPLPVADTRLILAKQAFTSLSSFGIFPVIATHGRRYFQQGNAGLLAEFARHACARHGDACHLQIYHTRTRTGVAVLKIAGRLLSVENISCG
jgi:hypothetical protein